MNSSCGEDTPLRRRDLRLGYHGAGVETDNGVLVGDDADMDVDSCRGDACVEETESSKMSAKSQSHSSCSVSDSTCGAACESPCNNAPDMS